MDTIYKDTLKNGLRVLTVPMKNTETVTALLFVGTGSHYEEKRVSGISHYLEHLFFKGSKKYPTPLIISSILDGVGADYNAFTSEEWTAFYIKLVEDKLELALDVISDFLERPLFTASEIEREKAVILEELHMYYDTPARRVFELLQEELYGDQPAGRDIGGIAKSVKAITRDDVLDYFGKQYRGENMVLVFAGKVNRAKGVRLARKYFDQIPVGAKDIEKRPVARLAPTTPSVRVEKKKTDQAHLALGFPAYSMQDEKRYALAVLCDALGGGMSSRLFTEVREKRGLAYRIRAGMEVGTDYGFTYINGGIAKGKMQDALKVIVDQLGDIKKNSITKEELEKAKNAIEGRVFLGLETSDDIAEFWGSQEVLLDETQTPHEYIKKVKAVTLADVQNVANEVFLKKEARLAIIASGEEPEKLKRILGKLA